MPKLDNRTGFEKILCYSKVKSKHEDGKKETKGKRQKNANQFQGKEPSSPYSYSRLPSYRYRETGFVPSAVETRIPRRRNNRVTGVPSSSLLGMSRVSEAYTTAKRVRKGNKKKALDKRSLNDYETVYLQHSFERTSFLLLFFFLGTVCTTVRFVYSFLEEKLAVWLKRQSGSR